MLCSKTLFSLPKTVQPWSMCLRRWKSDLTVTKSGIQDKNVTTGDTKISLPPEPKHCCMTGCANCVWIKYAQDVTQLCENGDVVAKNIIKEKVKDPQLRAFLFTQLGLKENL